MPFSELDNYHPYLEITTPSGVELEHWLNHTPRDIDELFREFPELSSGFNNENHLFSFLIQQGIVYTPEVPAFTVDGEERPDDQAFYVDKSIGIQAVREIHKWVNKFAALPEAGDEYERDFSETEVRVLAGMAMDELGITEKLAQIRRQDISQPTDTRYDLNAILQEARAYELGTPDDDRAQHLAPDDLI